MVYNIDVAEKYKDLQPKAVAALQSGQYGVELRGHIDEKNLLATRQVTEEFVIGLIRATRGHQVKRAPHHEMPEVTTWVLRPTIEVTVLDRRQTQRWYVKLYAVKRVIFMSVGPPER